MEPHDVATDTDRPENDTRGDSAVENPIFSDTPEGHEAIVAEPDPPPKKPRRRHPKTAVDKLESLSDDELLLQSGVEPVFSTTEVAEFFDRTTQWVYWGLRSENGKPQVFTHADGTPIQPERIGDPVRGRRRFTLPIIRDIMLASYRRGNLDPEELKTVLRRIRYTELGVEWREKEGWHYIDLGRNRHRWVHPDKCEYDAATKTWKLRPDAELDEG